MELETSRHNRSMVSVKAFIARGIFFGEIDHYRDCQRGADITLLVIYLIRSMPRRVGGFGLLKVERRVCMEA